MNRFDNLTLKFRSEAAEVAVKKPSGPDSSALYTVSGFLQGQPTVWLLDSGAEDSQIGVDTKAGMALRSTAIDSSRRSAGVTGKIQKLQVLPAVKIAFQNVEKTSDVYIQAHFPSTEADALLGMKELSNCKVLLGLEKALVRCE